MQKGPPSGGGEGSMLTRRHHRIHAFAIAALIAAAMPMARGEIQFFQDQSLDGWTVEGDGVWTFTDSDGEGLFLKSLGRGEKGMGRVISPPFTIISPFQHFIIAGADGTATGRNNGDSTYLALKSYPDGEELRRMRPPGTHFLTPARWVTADLMGREVYLELIDGNPQIRDEGFAWIGLGSYEQRVLALEEPMKTDDLYALPIDDGAQIELCRTVPFMAMEPGRAAATSRVVAGNREEIPVGTAAETVYLLGMINQGWDMAVGHWGYHPEWNPKDQRADQTHAGVKIGDLRIEYEDGASDVIPVILGSTAWYYTSWVYGTTHGVAKGCREPFASRPELQAVYDANMQLREATETQQPHTQFYLAVKPRDKAIARIVVEDNPEKLGRPLVSAITLLKPAAPEGMHHFAGWEAEAADLAPQVDVRKRFNFQKAADAIADVLYMSEADLPKSVDVLPFPEDLDATRIRFHGGLEADMLTNVWTANIKLIEEKFPADTGVFWESVPEIGPWYGGYSGFGTWAPVGVYWGENTAFARCTDHYATLALRLIDNDQRLTSFVDYVDHWLYFFRHDHDPANGPKNDALDLSQYPDGAYPNWSFVIPSPMGMPLPLDPIPGGQETCGHGATVVARWMAWRNLGARTGDWLTAPRDNVWGKSRWDSTHDAAEFICWYMDYSGMDVMFSEGETTGWGAGGPDSPLGLIPERPDPNDPVAVRKFFANSNMYEPYPTWTCCIGLRCSAQMADAMGEAELAERWRAYADRLQKGMLRLLRVGDHREHTWRVSPNSVYPSLQDSLVHAWFAFYFDGYDPAEWDQHLTPVTRNTLKRQLSQPYGHAPVLGMGYGQGWLTKSALLLDAMDDAGPLLWNIAKYSYDKNMDYVDEERGIDWRRWLYIIPEGANILEDGRWYRIGDLSNGANEGPPMHAIEICAGIDDTKPANLKILPRVPEPLTGIEVEDHFTLVPEGDGLTRARVGYTYTRGGAFELKSDLPLPNLSVRLGPFTEGDAKQAEAKLALPAGVKTRRVTSGSYHEADAWWVWVEGLTDVTELTL